MGSNKSWDKINYTQLWRMFVKTVTDGIQMLNHLRLDGNELLLARPNSNKSETRINYFCPVSIQHPLRVNPLLCCRDELIFAPVFTNHQDDIEELGYLLRSGVGVIIDNSFKKVMSLKLLKRERDCSDKEIYFNQRRRPIRHVVWIAAVITVTPMIRSRGNSLERVRILNHIADGNSKNDSKT